MAKYGFGYSIGNTRVSQGVSYDADASAYFAAVPNAFNDARKAIINTLVTTLKADGNWTELDRLWLFANTTTGNAVIDIKGLVSSTLVNAPAFVADQGYTGDGATSYINSGYNPATNGVKYTLNSASAGVYLRTNLAETTYDLGVESPARLNIISKHSDLSSYAAVNNDPPYLNTTPASTLGLSTSGRPNATTVKFYRDGIETGSLGANATALPNGNVFFMASNSSGSPIFPSTKQISIVYLGSGAITHSTLYTAIQAYMTSLGTQV